MTWPGAMTNGPGEKYEGSSARGAMKGWHKHGVCSAEHWRYKNPQDKPKFGLRFEDALRRPLGAYLRVNHKDIVAMHSAISEVGILYATGEVHSGWDDDRPRRHHQVRRDGRGARWPCVRHRRLRRARLLDSELLGHGLGLPGLRPGELRRLARQWERCVGREARRANRVAVVRLGVARRERGGGGLSQLHVLRSAPAHHQSRQRRSAEDGRHVWHFGRRTSTRSSRTSMGRPQRVRTCSSTRTAG